METLVRFLLLAAAGVILIIFLRPKSVFVIRIKDSKAQAKRGKVSRGFLEDCENLSAECNLRTATIKGAMKSGKVSLKFSRQIPKSYHQRFRNAYRFHS